MTAHPPDLETVRVVAEGAVGRLLLDRPQNLNALSPQMLDELIAAARWFDEVDAVKVVVVGGMGRAFCAGADLDAIGRSGEAAADQDDDARVREVVDRGRTMAEAIGAMRALTVAAIHGHCVGGGVVLAAACDLRVAAETARFSIPEVDIGIPLAWGGVPRLVRELGPALTKELVLTCRPFDAHEARALRFLNAVVPDEALDSAAQRLARKLAEQPAYALIATKRHVNAVAEEAGSTAQSFRDAETLLGALRDPESRGAMARYMQARRLAPRGEGRRPGAT
jgi:enoyl-CoA hydratase/carnithine racemase